MKKVSKKSADDEIGRGLAQLGEMHRDCVQVLARVNLMEAKLREAIQRLTPAAVTRSASLAIEAERRAKAGIARLTVISELANYISVSQPESVNPLLKRLLSVWDEPDEIWIGLELMPMKDALGQVESRAAQRQKAKTPDVSEG